MNLARMMTDKFFIEDQRGMRSGPFKTKFGSGTIMVFQNDLDVAKGDRIIRPFSEGSERAYIVESCSFNSGSRNIPGHFSITISELAETQETAVPPTSVAVDCTNPAAPGDNIDFHGIAASLQSLARAIDCSAFSSEQKNEANAILRSLLENPVVSAALAGSVRPA